MSEMEELLAKTKGLLEQGLSQSTNNAPWPVRFGDCSYPIVYTAKTYYLPKEIADIYHTLNMSEPNFFLSRLKKLAQNCASSCSWLGKNSFFQTMTGTGRTPPTQEIFNWLNISIQSCEKNHLTDALSCDAIALALSDKIVSKVGGILKAATTPKPWPLGWTGTLLAPILELSDKKYQVPQEIFQLYELAQLHRDPAARVKKVIALIQGLQKALHKEKHDWQHADVLDVPFLYAFGLRDAKVHTLSQELGKIVAEYHQKTSLPQSV